MNRRKPVNWEIDPEVNDLAGAIAEEHGTTKRAVVELGIRAAKDLMESHAKVARDAADPDVAALFLRAAALMPVWLHEQRVEAARFSGGRAALVIHDEGERWVLGLDDDAALMAVSYDGLRLGHIHNGRIEVIRDRLRDLQLESALN